MSKLGRVTKPILALGLVFGLIAGVTLARPGGLARVNSAEATSLQAVPGTWVSSVTVQNPSSSSTALVQIDFYDQNGTLMSGATQSQQVQPGKTAFWYVPNIPGLSSGRYSAVVSSDIPVFSTVNLSTAVGTQPVMAESYNGIGTTGTSFAVPSVLRNYHGYTSNIIVQNADSSTATVTASFRGKNDSSGTFTTTKQMTIPSGASFTLEQDSMTELGDGYIGAATINGGGKNIAVVTSAYTPNATTTGQFLISNGFPSGSKTVYIPGLYKNYHGFTSSLTVQNLSNSTASITVKYSNGTSETKSAAPNEAALFYTPNAPGLPNGWAGSAVVSASGGQNLIATVNINGNGGLASYNGFASGSSTVYAPGLLKAYHGFDSSLTIQNVHSSQTANVTVTYTNGAKETAKLGPGASQIFYQPNHSGLPNGFNGGATITTSGGSIVGLINISASGASGDQLYSTNAFGGS